MLGSGYKASPGGTHTCVLCNAVCMLLQAACIPLALTGRDICGSAVTGKLLSMMQYTSRLCVFICVACLVDVACKTC